MKRFRMFVVLALFASMPSLSLAYDEGDKLSPEVMAKLNIDPNKLTIIDFFAQWCVSCRIELPLVSDLSQQLDFSSIEVLGVDVDESEEVANAFQRSFFNGKGLAFRVVNDPTQFLVGAFGPLGMPAMYYVFQGQVIKVHIGAIPAIDQVILSDLREMGVM
jgi:thiol-disulfide isomerase/thioredoxin